MSSWIIQKRVIQWKNWIAQQGCPFWCAENTVKLISGVQKHRKEIRQKAKDKRQQEGRRKRRKKNGKKKQEKIKRKKKREREREKFKIKGSKDWSKFGKNITEHCDLQVATHLPGSGYLDEHLSLSKSDLDAVEQA